jgi:hypothetical protein
VLRVIDEQWELIRKHFPEVHSPDDRAGCKPAPARKVLGGRVAYGIEVRAGIPLNPGES